MLRSLHYVFPVASTTDVCLQQTLTGTGNLSLNGNLANSINSQVSFLEKGYSRQISLTSANDLSGREFIVTGFQNGVALTEYITGPNATTVYSTKIYDTITSIIVDGAVIAVSVGTGHAGFFPLIAINLNRDVINYVLSTAALTAASIHTTIYNTVSNISFNSLTFLDQVTNSQNLFEIKASSADEQFILPVADRALCRSILIHIDGTAGEITNSIEMNFIQT